MRHVCLSRRALTRICCGLVAWVTAALGGFGLVQTAPIEGTLDPVTRQNVDGGYGITPSSCYGCCYGRITITHLGDRE